MEYPTCHLYFLGIHTSSSSLKKKHGNWNVANLYQNPKLDRRKKENTILVSKQSRDFFPFNASFTAKKG